MRVIPAVVMAGLLALSGTALARPPQAAAKHATSKSADAPPLTRLPQWAVPESYDLAIKSDPDKSDYSGTVTIAVDLK
jgi:alanyl aminopeptidase